MRGRCEDVQLLRFFPRLQTLDVSDSPGFAGLPYSVCTLPSLKELRLAGTIAATALNWRAQLQEANASEHGQPRQRDMHSIM